MKNRPKECIYTCALKRHMVIGEFVLVGAMIKKAKLTPSFTIIMTKHEYHRFSKKGCIEINTHTYLVLVPEINEALIPFAESSSLPNTVSSLPFSLLTSISILTLADIIIMWASWPLGNDEHEQILVKLFIYKVQFFQRLDSLWKHCK